MISPQDMLKALHTIIANQQQQSSDTTKRPQVRMKEYKSGLIVVAYQRGGEGGGTMDDLTQSVVRLVRGRHNPSISATTSALESAESLTRAGVTATEVGVELGVSTGEIAPERRPVVFAFILTVLVGLTDAVSDDPKVQSQAITGIKDAVSGLLHPRVLR